MGRARYRPVGSAYRALGGATAIVPRAIAIGRRQLWTPRTLFQAT
jgi:hypothetical protein